MGLWDDGGARELRRRLTKVSPRSIPKSNSKSEVMAWACWVPPVTHLHKHPLALNIILILFQGKDEEEVQALEEEGWKPRLGHSAQRLLQGKSPCDPRSRAKTCVRPAASMGKSLLSGCRVLSCETQAIMGPPTWLRMLSLYSIY